MSENPRSRPHRSSRTSRHPPRSTGAPAEAPKEEVGGSNRTGSGHHLRPYWLHYSGAFTAIPTVIFAIIALVMVKRGTGKGKVSWAIVSLVLVVVAMVTFVLGNNARSEACGT